MFCSKCFRWFGNGQRLCAECCAKIQAEALHENEVRQLLGSCSCNLPGSSDPFDFEAHEQDCHLGGWPAFHARHPWPPKPEPKAGSGKLKIRKPVSRGKARRQALAVELDELLETRTGVIRGRKGRFVRALKIAS